MTDTIDGLQIRWDEYDPLELEIERAAQGEFGRVAQIVADLVLFLQGLNVALMEQDPGAIVPLVLGELERAYRELGGEIWIVTNRPQD